MSSVAFVAADKLFGEGGADLEEVLFDKLVLLRLSCGSCGACEVDVTGFDECDL